MKKIILAVLLTLVFTSPYLSAQEPDNPTSIEGTQWITSGIRTSIEPPYFKRVTSIVGFFQETVYSCDEEDVCEPLDDFSYIDLPVISFAYILSFSVLPVNYRVELLIMQPAGGFGQIRDISWWRKADCIPSVGQNCINGYFTIGTMIKIQEDWTPPEVE